MTETRPSAGVQEGGAWNGLKLFSGKCSFCRSLRRSAWSYAKPIPAQFHPLEGKALRPLPAVEQQKPHNRQQSIIKKDHDWSHGRRRLRDRIGNGTVYDCESVKTAKANQYSEHLKGQSLHTIVQHIPKPITNVLTIPTISAAIRPGFVTSFHYTS